MSEPCISKSAHNYNCFLYDTKEELQQLQQSYLIVPFLIKTIKHLLYGTATSNSKQDLRN